MSTRPSHEEREARCPGQGMKPLTVSVKTARALLDLGNTKMWELIKDGRVDTVSFGRKRLVVYESLEKLLKPTKAG
jgi:hypothetical protein